MAFSVLRAARLRGQHSRDSDRDVAAKVQSDALTIAVEYPDPPPDNQNTAHPACNVQTPASEAESRLPSAIDDLRRVEQLAPAVDTPPAILDAWESATAPLVWRIRRFLEP